MKSNIGIQIILSIVLTMCSININAQTVGYTYRPLAAEGCNMKYSVAKQDTAYYIIATVKSDRLNFLKESSAVLNEMRLNDWKMKPIIRLRYSAARVSERFFIRLPASIYSPVS